MQGNLDVIPLGVPELMSGNWVHGMVPGRRRALNPELDEVGGSLQLLELTENEDKEDGENFDVPEDG